METRRLLLLAGVGTLVLTACTAIVAGDLNGFSVSDAGPTNPGATDACALVTDPDASNACSQCIEHSCGAEVTYACNGTAATNGQPEPWFMTLQNCAMNPVQNADLDWGCYSYETDAGMIQGNDDTAHKRASELCVRDNCLEGIGNTNPTPPCHQCGVQTNKPDTADLVNLDDSQCGQCIRGKCGALLVQCCANLPPDLAKCGYPQAPEYKAACLAVFDAGGPDAAPGPNADEDIQCAYEVATQCFKGCETVCQ